MNTPHRTSSPSRIEILESRIAPAAITLSFFDQDNKAVSVTSTKGTLAQLATAVGVASGATAMAPLAFTFGTIFKGADITVVAGPSATDLITTRILSIDADGVDLGKVTIDGELDRIDAGDNVSSSAGINTLTVGKWGNGDAFDSVVIGRINALTVQGDFNGAYLKVRGSDSNAPTPPAHKTDLDGKIGTLFIGGSLLGTARDNGGHIWATGDMPKITVAGSVTGFRAAMAPMTPPTDQDFSGRIFSGGIIGSISIGTDAAEGNLLGGDGSFSGQIVGVVSVGNITVKGRIEGGIGLESGAIGTAGSLGKINVTKSLLGGGGDRSGTLLSHDTIGDVTVGQDITGGKGENSGAIGAVGNIGNVSVVGNLTGGDGISSGQIVSQATIKSVTIGGNLVGGSEFETGSIGSLEGLGPILVKGSIFSGAGTRSGLIATQQLDVRRIDVTPVVPQNAPIASVTVLGSISGIPPLSKSTGDRSGGILSSGQLGPVVVKGDLLGGDQFQTGRIASSSGITSVEIGGKIQGGDGDESGTVFASGKLGPVAIGDPNFHPTTETGFDDTGIRGGFGYHSGAVLSGSLAKIDVFGQLAGGAGERSGVIETTGSGAAGKMGAVFIRADVLGGDTAIIGFLVGDEVTPGISIGGSALRSGAIISSGSIASVQIGTVGMEASDLTGGTGVESGLIVATLDIGPVTISESLFGGDGDRSGSVVAQGKIASVNIGADVRGGDGDFSGLLVSGGTMGSVAIGTNPLFSSGNILGGAGATSGGIESGGKLARVDVFGSVIGGDGPRSASIRTVGSGAAGDMGPIFIADNLNGGIGSRAATDAGSIISTGKIASIVIGDPKDSDTESGSVFGGNALRSGSITSGGDLGAVKIKVDLQGGSGNESGKITSRGKLASLTIGTPTITGSLIGGEGNYDTTSESGFEFGQVVAVGAIGPVVITGDIKGDPSSGYSGGDYAAQIRGLSIASATVGGNILGGSGDHSGGLFAAQNIGPVVADELGGGDGAQSGFISAEGNIPSVKIGSSFFGGTGPGSAYVAAGDTLGSLEAGLVSGNSDSSRPRISATNKIGSVTVNRSIFDSDILAGYNTSGFEQNPDAQIGTVKIGTIPSGEITTGIMQGTNIVAGLSAGNNHVFGDLDDHAILGLDAPAIHSKIASVIVSGSITNTSGSGDRYAIIAEHLVSVKIGASNLPLTTGPLNDFYKPVGVSLDTVYGELPDTD